MFIVCPKCSAYYQLPAGISLENGQKIKCSACEHIFLKGEEAPLELTPAMAQTPVETPAATTPVPDSPASEWNNVVPTDISAETEAEPLPAAFQTPLYEQAIMPTARPDTLPEAFVPVAQEVPPVQPKKGLWFLPVYIAFIIAFCWLAWLYRDMLTPSFYQFMPTQKTTVQKKVVSVAPVVPVKPTPVVPQQKAEVPPKIVEPVKEVKPVVAPTPVVPEIIQPITPEPTPVIAPVVTPTPVIAPVVTPMPEPTPDTPAPVSAPTPTVDTPAPVVATKPVTPAPVPSAVVPPTAVIEDEAPLFDMMAEPVPVALEDELAIQNIEFKVTPDENGQHQMLIEGVLHNQASAVRSVPVLMATVWDKNSQILTQKKVHVSQDRLNPGETVPFYTSIVPAPVDAVRVEVVF